jgi:hypothetical protein
LWGASTPFLDLFLKKKNGIFFPKKVKKTRKHFCLGLRTFFPKETVANKICKKKF